MNLILILIVGGIIGWLASIVMRTNAQQGIFLNVVVGIVGALLAGFLLAPLFGTGTITRATSACPRCWSRSSARSFCWRSSTCSAAARCVEKASKQAVQNPDDGGSGMHPGPPFDVSGPFAFLREIAILTAPAPSSP